MADNLDEIFAQAHATPATGGGGTDLDSIFAQAHASTPTTGTDWMNEILAAGNSGVRAAGSTLDLLDAVNRNINPLYIGGPRLFGLNETILNSPDLQRSVIAAMEGEEVAKAAGLKPSDKLKSGAEYIGLYGPEKAKTEPGKFAENVTENAVSAAPFGPLAMAASGVFGGTGGYLGEKTSEFLGGTPETGRAVGSFLGGISPAGIKKLGIVKELGEQLGPTVSQFPVLREIFGNTPVKAAVGRAISKASDDLPRTEAALREAVEQIGPPTELQSLKTTAEVAGDRGLARAEDAAQNMRADAPFAQISADRAALRARNVMNGYDPSQTAYETSKALEGTIGASSQALDDVAEKAWKAFAGDTPIVTNIPEAADDFARSLDEITYSGALPIEGEAAGLIKKFNSATDSGVVSAGVLQKLRSKALEVKRRTSGLSNSSDRVANDVASALEAHIRNLVDTNVDKGLVPAEQASKWIAARDATKASITPFAAPKPGTENTGTRLLEQLAVKGQSLDNTALLREGLNSPDKMVAHIQAAAAGGQDVRPLYQQALKSELDGAAQKDWRGIIDRRRNQWEMVFSPEEMQNLERNLADVDQEMVKLRGAFTTGSQTNPRGNIQREINSQKGLAGVVGGTSIPAVIGAVEGARQGWNRSETTAGGVANALLYGAGGALIGKGISSSASRASESFDNLFTEALRSPGKALEAIDAAKPSNFTQRFGDAILDTAKTAAIKEADRQIKNIVGDVFKSQTAEQSQSTPAEGAAGPKQSDSAIDDVFSKAHMEAKQPVSMVEDIDEGRFVQRASEVADTIGVSTEDLLKVIHFETGGTFDPTEKNRAGSGGTGLIQFMPATAQELTGEETKAEAIKILESMSATEQLDYVEKYLAPYKGKINSLDDLYMAILYPRAIGKDAEYVLFRAGTKAYTQNAGLDLNDDGVITKSEAADRVRKV